MINYLFNLETGFVLFFYGINLINNILEKANKDKIKNIIIKKFNPIKGVIEGIIITIIVQSSSFITVLLTNLVNQNIITLYQSTSIIMGSNIGTCIFAFIISFMFTNSFNINNSFLLGIMSMISFLLFIKKKNNYGNFIIGLIIIMLSMKIISNNTFIKNIQNYHFLFKYLTNPVIGLFIGIILTTIFQSSTLITGLLCSINLYIPINYLAGINLILGSNIGTCSTAIIGSLSLNTNAKKVAMFHLLFNVIGSILFIIIIYLFNYLNNNILLKNMTTYSIPFIHLLFNVLTAIMILPFTKKVLKLCNYLIK